MENKENIKNKKQIKQEKNSKKSLNAGEDKSTGNEKSVGKEGKIAAEKGTEEKEIEQAIYKVGILGEKLGMSQVFNPAGNVVAVSVVKAYPGIIIQVKTGEKEGYNALRVAFKEVSENKLNKPLDGIFKKNKIAAHKILREFKVNNLDECKIGGKILINQFEKGGFIDVTGVSKGKGFQGVVKRYNFKGGPKTRGQSNKWRCAGSIGAGSDPGKVWKGRRMPGRMGNETKTIQNLEIIDIDKDNSLLLIKGSIPGPRNGIVNIKHAVKKL